MSFKSGVYCTVLNAVLIAALLEVMLKQVRIEQFIGLPDLDAVG